jgi:hypothetical protein
LRTSAREIDRCFSVHPRSRWNVAIELVGWNHLNPIMLPISFMFVFTHVFLRGNFLFDRHNPTTNIVEFLVASETVENFKI